MHTLNLLNLFRMSILQASACPLYSVTNTSPISLLFHSHPSMHQIFVHTLTMANPSLGDFAAFPAEIRLLIWDYLYTRGGHSRKARKHNKTDLRMLRASRQLYDEIWTHLFSHMEYIEFRLAPCCGTNYWMECFDQWHQRRWAFTGAGDSMWYRFQGFPHHKIGIYVRLLAPSSGKRSAELRFLWRNVEELIQFLDTVGPIRRLIVRLEDTPSGSWLDQEGKPVVNIHRLQYFATDQRRRAWPWIGNYLKGNREGLATSFYRLRNDIHEMKISASVEFEKMFHDSLACISKQFVMESPYIIPADYGVKPTDSVSRRIYIAVYQGNILYLLPKETAAVLRLEPYRYWSNDLVEVTPSAKGNGG
jgi:hypothetical protein